MICKDCGKPFVAAGKNVVVCPGCVDVRLGKKSAKKPRKTAQKANAAPVAEAPATVSSAPTAPAPKDMEALAAVLAATKLDLMDANAEATRLWRENRVLVEDLRRARMRIKELEGGKA